MGNSRNKLMLDIITYSLLIFGAVFMITPFLWMIATSFKLPADQYTKTFFPNPATLNNFKELFGTHIDFPLLFFNSFLISIWRPSGSCSHVRWLHFVSLRSGFNTGTYCLRCC